MRASAPLGAGLLVALLALGGGCKRDAEEGGAPPLASLKPEPLPEIAPGAPASADQTFQVEAAEVFGEELPEGAARIELRGGTVAIDGEAVQPETAGGAQRVLQIAQGLAAKERPALLVPDEDTFLAQASALFAALDDAKVKAWLLHPEGKVAFPVTLSDEADFQRWLDAETFTGRIRVIHRSDGYELQTNVGKLPGFDPNGPSVPLRGGQWDVARLRASLQALAKRFSRDEEICLVPSFGMELRKVGVALSGFYEEPEEPIFEHLCLVYPRPGGSPDAGAQPAP